MPRVFSKASSEYLHDDARDPESEFNITVSHKLQQQQQKQLKSGGINFASGVPRERGSYGYGGR